jgi:uncharacterized membrane protein HdeD (DUF308 family)
MSSYESKGTETPPKWRAWMHIGMGVVYLLFGFLIFYVKRFGSIDLSEPIVYGMSILLCLYGIFRLWRGITDLRMINRQQ